MELEKLEEQNRLFETYAFCLSDVQKNILKQFLVDGFQLNEIAENLGSSRQAVSKNQLSAMKKLVKMENSLHFLKFQDKMKQEVNALCTLCEKEDYSSLKKHLQRLKKEL